MKTLLGQDLKELIERPRGLCVSLYMPTQRAGSALEGPPRLANLLDRAEAGLVEAGLRSAQARKMLEAARGLETNAGFWSNQSDGLAVFVGEGLLRYHRLPFSFPETCSVAYRFQVKPLIKMFGEDRTFFVLALSQNSVRLLRCTQDSVAVVTPAKVPQSLAEFLKFDSQERHSELHAAGSKGGTPGRAASVFHGRGGADYEKENLPRFLGAINKGLHEVLRDEDAPMVIAAVEFLHPMYHKENTYLGLIEKGVQRNPDILSERELQQRGWELVMPFFFGATFHATFQLAP